MTFEYIVYLYEEVSTEKRYRTIPIEHEYTDEEIEAIIEKIGDDEPDPRYELYDVAIKQRDSDESCQRLDERSQNFINSQKAKQLREHAERLEKSDE